MPPEEDPPNPTGLSSASCLKLQLARPLGWFGGIRPLLAGVSLGPCASRDSGLDGEPLLRAAAFLHWSTQLQAAASCDGSKGSKLRQAALWWPACIRRSSCIEGCSLSKSDALQLSSVNSGPWKRCQNHRPRFDASMTRSTTRRAPARARSLNSGLCSGALYHH